MISKVSIGEKQYNLTDIAQLQEYLKQIAEILKKAPINARFQIFNNLLRGIEFKFPDVQRFEDYFMEGAYCNIKELDNNIVLKQANHDYKHPMWVLLRFIYENFPGCRWPTAGILGALQNGVFRILSFGANYSYGVPKTGEYYIDEVGKEVLVEFEEKGLAVRAKKCPRKLVPECTTGKCYGACASVCMQVSHTERDVVLNAGLGRIINIDKLGKQPFIVESFKYQGPGELTLLFLGHWWFCRPCCDALVGAGIKNIIVLSPEKFKTWNWQGHPLED